MDTPMSRQLIKQIQENVSYKTQIVYCLIHSNSNNKMLGNFLKVIFMAVFGHNYMRQSTAVLA